MSKDWPPNCVRTIKFLSIAFQISRRRFNQEEMMPRPFKVRDLASKLLLLASLASLMASPAVADGLEEKVRAGTGSDQAMAVFVTGAGATSPLNAAVGFADKQAKRPMTVDTPARIASNTKTFVAAAALRLWEEGKLDLDAPIGPLLTPSLDALLRADGYPTENITLRQLMSHSAGLYDHGGDKRYFDAITADPAHRWTREEQVRLSMQYADPQNPPGTMFQYSDTGYILLGDIVERTAGEPLPAAVRRLLGFDRLGLNSTWWEIAENPGPHTEPRARQYIGPNEGTGWDGSFDLYGGGGLVMSARDLATLFAALFEGRVFRRPETLQQMLWEGPHRGGDYYRLGIFADKLGDDIYYWHSGFWGTIAYYSPRTGLSAAGIVTDQMGSKQLRQIVGEAVGIPAGQVPPVVLKR